ncbi:MAG: glycosyltransferase [Bacteroidota bacterium]
MGLLRSSGGMSRQHWLILPDAGDIPSGGHLYNAHVFAALKKADISVHWKQWEAVSDSDWQLLLRQEEAVIWVDSLYLAQLAESTWLNQQRQAKLGMLVHHLESLHPPEGQDGADFFDQYERNCLSSLDAFWCTSTFTEVYLKEKKVGDQAYVVVPPALPAIPKRSIPSQGPVSAILVANWVERKGIVPFLEALAEQLQPTDEFQLYLAGSEAIEPDYARQGQRWLAFQDELAQRTTVLGAIPQEQLWRLYPVQHLLISAAQMETYGMAMQEGRAFGLPILALDGGYAYAHVEAGKTGHLCETYADLATTFLHLIRQPEGLQQLMETAAAEQPNYPSWEAAARRYVELVD